MPDKKELYARKRETSGQVSTITRGLALAFIGVAWTLLTAHDEPLRSMAAGVSKYLMLALAFSSVLVLVLDLFQYVATTSVADDALKRAEADPNGTALYDDSSRAYKAHKWLYRAKFSFLLVGAMILLVIFILLFLGIRHASATP